MTRMGPCQILLPSQVKGPPGLVLTSCPACFWLTFHTKSISVMIALNAMRLSQQMPNVGDSRVACPQANRNLEVALAVRTTPNPSFRRVNAQVFDGTTLILSITTVLGRY